MIVLFVGLGSVGQRHLQNFQALMGDDSIVYAFRNTKNNFIISNGEGKKVDSIEDYYGINSVNSLDEGLKKNPEIVFITNPSSFHVKTAIECAKSGANIFIEKPLSHNLDDIDELKSILEIKNLSAVVAYQTKHNPAYRFAKKIINSKKYGDIISGNFKWGTYLPDHHPYEDYKTSYASRKDLGGGVVLGLSHEIDIIRDLFGMPDKIIANEKKNKSLSIDVEETVYAEFIYNHVKKNSFQINLFLSYAHKPEERFFEIEFKDVTLNVDLDKNIVSILGKKKEKILIKDFSNINRNELFLNELTEFIETIKKGEKNIQLFNDGTKTLKICLEILEIINTNNAK